MTSAQSQFIKFNGEPFAVYQAQTVASFINMNELEGRFVVVLNEQVLPRSAWAERVLNTGDHLEIMSPISGG